jgi:sec-independent protein translocase protein TatB
VNLIGMGPMEVLLIVILALIVFGPAKLPEIMGQVGKAIADFRKATSELSDEFNRTIQSEINQTRATLEEPLKETRATLEDPLRETRSALQEATSSVTSVGVASPAPDTSGVAPSEGLATTMGATARANGSGTAETPPLADTSQWNWETSPGSEPAAPNTQDAEPKSSDTARTTPTEASRDELLPPY